MKSSKSYLGNDLVYTTGITGVLFMQANQKITVQ
jgi:hypothetical protein